MIFCRLSEPYSSSSKKIFNVKKIKFLNYSKNKSGKFKVVRDRGKPKILPKNFCCYCCKAQRAC